MLSDDLIRHLIKLLRPEPGLPLARIDLPGMHPVCHPVAAIIAVIEEKRLKIIYFQKRTAAHSPVCRTAHQEVRHCVGCGRAMIWTDKVFKDSGEAT